LFNDALPTEIPSLTATMILDKNKIVHMLFLPEHRAMKAYWGMEVQLHACLTSTLDGGQFHAPASFPQGKTPWYPLYRRVGGPQSRSGNGGEKNS
jgi:hypothetical protein